MDIYEMIKQGMSKEEIFEAYKSEYKAAKQQVAKDKEAELAAMQTEALKSEARAHLINAVLAYSEAFGIETSEEDAKELEDELLKLEKFIEVMLRGGLGLGFLM